MYDSFCAFTKRIFFLTALASAFLSCSNHSSPNPVYSWSGLSTLEELTQQLSQDLKDKIGLSKLYFDADKFTLATTNETLPLSKHLHNQLEASLTEAGFNVVGVMGDAEYLLEGEFRKVGPTVDFFFKVYSGKGASTFFTFKYQLPKQNIADDLLSESLEIRAKKLAEKLLATPRLYKVDTDNGQRIKIFVNPIVERKNKYTTPFSEYYLSQICSVLINSDRIDIVKKKPVKTRSLAPRLKNNLAGSDALLSNAQAVLSGEYNVSNDFVTVSLEIIDQNGSQIGGVDQKIPREAINLSLENPIAQKVVEPADVAQESTKELIKISTDKGSAHQVYTDGEAITFFIQVARPLYVYVYSFNSKNEVTLLYPMPDDNHGKLSPNQLYTIPPNNSDWEIIVQPPYGLDVVKIFASDKPLPLPQLNQTADSRSFSGGTRSIVRRDKIQQQLATQTVIHPLDVVDYFKGKASQFNARLYEDHIFVQTQPN